MHKRILTLLSLILFLLITACSHNANDKIAAVNFKKYYDEYQVDGSFVLYDSKNDRYTFYHPEQYEESFTPASTFKICNSIIGLETGVIKDEHFVIPWDSVNRQNPEWNKDTDLKTAYKNSTVWYYQELARRVGEPKMKEWLDSLHYGNTDTIGGVDKFWLTGGLRISPKQQIDFLKRLHNNQLPVSTHTLDMVKRVMIAKDTLGYVIRAKTGWGGQADKDIGWYVGYVETKDNVYYFANCIQAPTDRLVDMDRVIAFDKARKEIVYRVLEELKITTPTK